MTTRAAFLVMALVLSGCSAPGTVTPYLYDNGPDYLSEGLMRIQDSSGKIGYADEKGEIVISPQFAFGYPFKNGHAKVTLQGHEEVVPGSNGEMHAKSIKKHTAFQSFRTGVFSREPLASLL